MVEGSTKLERPLRVFGLSVWVSRTGRGGENSIGQAPAPDPGHQKVSLRHEAAMADGADRGRDILSRP